MRKQLQNELASKGIQSLYVMGGEIAKQAILLDSMAEIGDLLERHEQAVQQGLPDYARHQQVEQLRLQLISSLSESTGRLETADITLHGLFPKIPCGPTTPEIDLISDPPCLDELACIENALRNRPENDPQLVCAERRASQASPVYLIDDCPADSIAVEVREAIVALRTASELLRSANDGLSLADEHLSRMLERNELLQSSDFEVGLARIQVNEQKVRLVERLVEFQVARTRLLESQGLFGTDGCGCQNCEQAVPSL
jgi:outer membrane protein TolC